MKPRINLVRFRLFRIGHKRRWKPGPDDGKFRWADLLTSLATLLCLLPLNLNLGDLLEQHVPYGAVIRENLPLVRDIIFIIAAIIMLIGIYFYFHDLAPRPRWKRALWAVGMIALTWSVLPFILHWLNEDNALSDMCRVSLWSISMWVVWLFCCYKYWRVRIRTKQELMRIELLERRERKRRIYE